MKTVLCIAAIVILAIVGASVITWRFTKRYYSEEYEAAREWDLKDRAEEVDILNASIRSKTETIVKLDKERLEAINSCTDMEALYKASESENSRINERLKLVGEEYEKLSTALQEAQKALSDKDAEWDQDVDRLTELCKHKVAENDVQWGAKVKALEEQLKAVEAERDQFKEDAAELAKRLTDIQMAAATSSEDL